MLLYAVKIWSWWSFSLLMWNLRTHQSASQALSHLILETTMQIFVWRFQCHVFDDNIDAHVFVEQADRSFRRREGARENSPKELRQRSGSGGVGGKRGTTSPGPRSHSAFQASTFMAGNPGQQRCRRATSARST